MVIGKLLLFVPLQMVVQNNKGGTICTTYYGGTIKYSGTDNETKMNKDKHIPTGYKPSPLGPIPEDWEVKRLGEICKKIGSGVTPRGGQNVYLSQGHPFMRSQNVANGYLLLDDIVFIDEITHLKQKSTEIELDDVLLNITGASIGRCAVATQEIVGGNVNQHVCIIRLKDKTLAYYICTFLLSYFGQKQIDSYQAGGNREGLNYDQIASFKICIPTQSEILQIKYLLSLWDTAIAKQTALIEKLTLRKRGLMQQLLTGKKRLKGFCGEWKEVRLGDVASINRGGSPRPIEDYITDGEGYNWIKIGDVGVDAKYITSTEEKIIKEGLSKTRFVKSGDFILSNSMSFGRPYILKIDGCIHDGWLVIQKYSQTFNIDFLYYILGYDTTLAQYKSMAAGSGVLNLNKEIVKEVQLRIPSIDEQIVIASILVNADKEIELQKQKLAAMQEQKRGLMQVLLTGKEKNKNNINK